MLPVPWTGTARPHHADPTWWTTPALFVLWSSVGPLAIFIELYLVCGQSYETYLWEVPVSSFQGILKSASFQSVED